MKKVALLAVGVVLFSVPLFPGEFLINDTGQSVHSLLVVFSEPVSITGYSDVLLSVEPIGESTEFTFFGGELAAWGWHWLNWKPLSARLVEYEWTMCESPAVENRTCRVGEYQLELVSETSMCSPDDANVDILRLWAAADGDTIVVSLEFRGLQIANYIEQMRTLIQIYFRRYVDGIGEDNLYKIAITGHEHEPGLYGPPNGSYVALIPSEITLNRLTVFVPKDLLPPFETIEIWAEVRTGRWGTADTADEIRGDWTPI